MPGGTITLYKPIGYVYKIQHKSNNNLKKYYGSTKDLNKRESDHKGTCNNPNYKAYNHPKYQYIREHDGWDNWEMIKIYQGENYELKEKEFIISTWEINTNKYIPLLTEEEKKEYHKEYYEDNKEHYKEYRKKKKEEVFVCEYCGKNYSYNHKARHQRTIKCRKFQE